METTWKYNDGGRAEAGYKGTCGDCATRAIAIATGLSYKEVYKNLNEGLTCFKILNLKYANRNSNKSTCRDGTPRTVARKYLESIGWEYVPTMLFGKGCKVHLDANELPMGRLIIQTAKHYTTMIDGVINDTYDPRLDDFDSDGNKVPRYINKKRCVYGYFKKVV